MKPQASQVAVDEACESPAQWQCWNWAPRIDPWNSAGTNGRKSKPVQGETWDQAGWTKAVRCYRKTKQTLTDLQKKTWPHVQPKTTLSYNRVPGDKIHLSFSNILSTYIGKKWVCVRRETPHARDIIAGMRNTHAKSSGSRERKGDKKRKPPCQLSKQRGGQNSRNQKKRKDRADSEITGRKKWKKK